MSRMAAKSDGLGRLYSRSLMINRNLAFLLAFRALVAAVSTVPILVSIRHRVFVFDVVIDSILLSQTRERSPWSRGLSKL